MKKIFFILFTSCLFQFHATAQVQSERTVTANGGSWLSGPGISLSVTIGEPVTTTIGGASAILTQGFQQPDLLSVGIALPSEGYTLQAFPNPVSDILALEITSIADMDISLSVYDLTGRMTLPDRTHFVSSAITNRFYLNMQTLAPAVYILQIQSLDRYSFHKTIQIVKSY